MASTSSSTQEAYIEWIFRAIEIIVQWRCKTQSSSLVVGGVPESFGARTRVRDLKKFFVHPQQYIALEVRLDHILIEKYLFSFHVSPTNIRKDYSLSNRLALSLRTLMAQVRLSDLGAGVPHVELLEGQVMDPGESFEDIVSLPSSIGILTLSRWECTRNPPPEAPPFSPSRTGSFSPVLHENFMQRQLHGEAELVIDIQECKSPVRSISDIWPEKSPGGSETGSDDWVAEVPFFGEHSQDVQFLERPVPVIELVEALERMVQRHRKMG
jgi:hypothetical protein